MSSKENSRAFDITVYRGDVDARIYTVLLPGRILVLYIRPALCLRALLVQKCSIMAHGCLAIAYLKTGRPAGWCARAYPVNIMRVSASSRQQWTSDSTTRSRGRENHCRPGGRACICIICWLRARRG